MSYTEKEVQGVIQGMVDAINQQKGKMESRFEGYDKMMDEFAKTLSAIETAVARGQLPGGGSSRSDFGGANAEDRRAFSAFLRSGKIMDAMRTDSDPDGGFTVPLSINDEIARISGQKVTMRKLATVAKGAGDYRKLICHGGAASGWATERSTREATDTPELAAVNFIFGELYANAAIYNWLIQDSQFEIASWLINEISIAFAEAENDAFLTGNGVGKPKGVTDYDFVSTADSTRTWGQLQYIAGGHATLLNSADKLVKLVHTLAPGYHDGASFIMNPTTAETVRILKDGNGNYIWRPGLESGLPGMLLGFPCHLDEFMPSIGANEIPVLFGNFQRGYFVLDHSAGLRIIRDEVTTKGMTSFYAARRVAGAVVDFNAIKGLKVAAS
jgi:HK97 family phage major capsid protein